MLEAVNGLPCQSLSRCLSVRPANLPIKSNSAIRTPARLAVAIATLRSSERIVLVSIESAGKASKRAPQMIREIQQYCGADLPYIVGADLNT